MFDTDSCPSTYPHKTPYIVSVAKISRGLLLFSVRYENHEHFYQLSWEKWKCEGQASGGCWERFRFETRLYLYRKFFLPVLLNFHERSSRVCGGSVYQLAIRMMNCRWSKLKNVTVLRSEPNVCWGSTVVRSWDAPLFHTAPLHNKTYTSNVSHFLNCTKGSQYLT